MRIVIELEGDKVTSISTDTPASAAGPADVPPGPPPAALLERARKMGAMSAGAAQFGMGAALAATAAAGETPVLVKPRRGSKPSAPRHRRAARKGGRPGR